MKRILSLMITVVLVISMIITVNAVNISDDIISENEIEEKIITTVNMDDNFKDDEIIVVLNNCESKKLNEYSVLNFDELPVKSVENLTKATDDLLKTQREAEVKGLQRFSSESATGEEGVYIDEEKYHQFYLLKLSKIGKANVIKCIKLLEQRDDVILAMPNYFNTIEPLKESVATTDEMVASTYATTTAPNDYTDKYGQWGIERIKLPEAWTITTGNSSVIVGVMDSGIKSNHEDLSANIAASSYHKNCTNDGTSALSDQGGHGTQVAGVIAAVGNNNKGTVGACWNVKLASLKVFSYDNERREYVTDTSFFVDAVIHAKAKGISILNYSAGGGGRNEDVLTELINYSGLFVCAAGNGGVEVTGTNYYPPSYNLDNMIVVAKGSQNTNDALASDSNYSSTYVDLSAPGVNILTTDKDSTSDYIVTEGSSISAPYVTGVAALLKGKYPAMSASAIKYYITDNVDKKSALSGKVSTGGRLNAYKALNGVKKFTVKYNANGGTGTMSDTTVIYNNTTALRSNQFTKSGKVFLGWHSKRASDGKCYYTNGSSKKWYIEGQQPSGYYKYLYPNGATLSKTSSVNGDTITMYAQWDVHYTVTFNSNGGTGPMQNISAKYSEPYTLTTNAFSRTGYHFDHWYAKKSDGSVYCTGQVGGYWYQTSEIPDGYFRKAFENSAGIVAESLQELVHGDVVTMYVHWEPNAGLLGDVNMDGTVAVTDATLVQKYLADLVSLTSAQRYLADVDYNGVINAQDATKINKYVGGIIKYWDE